MALKLFKSVVKSATQGVTSDPELQKVVARYPRFFGFFKKRLTPDERFGLHLTVGALITIIFIFIFFGVVQDVIGREPLIAADLRIINLIQIFQTPLLSKIMLLITYLGNWQIICLGIIFVGAYLIFVKRFYYLLALLVSVGGGEIFVWLVKHIIARPRPPLINALVREDGFSFPSGHMFVAISFYGLITYFIWHRKKNFWIRTADLIIGLIIIAAIGLSRVYLGVHWPSDVLASIAAGLAWLAVIITALEIRRKFSRRPRGLPFFTPSGRSFLGLAMGVVWLLFVGYFFSSHPLITHSVLATDKERLLNKQELPDGLFNNLPKTSENITGIPMEPINLIFVAGKKELIDVFQQKEWYLTDPITVKTMWHMVKAAIFNESYPQAPGTPTFWDSRPNDFAFEHGTAEQSIRERHHVHFWDTPFVLADGRAVWFATAHFDKKLELGKNLMPAHTIDPAIDKERDNIKTDLLATGKVETIREFKIVEPTLGKNQSGDLFFTDGKAEIIFLKK